MTKFLHVKTDVNFGIKPLTLNTAQEEDMEKSESNRKMGKTRLDIKISTFLKLNFCELVLQDFQEPLLESHIIKLD